MKAVYLVGRTAAVRDVERAALSAAVGDAPVLITGEPGVGKETVARFIHQHSARGRGGFGSIRCGGVPDVLLASALFGHVKDSFTGATGDKQGLLESRVNGTIFLRDIGATGLHVQAGLMRVLESGDLQRIGDESRQVGVNVRIIAGANRDLVDKIRDLTFRQDLHLRLNASRMEVPPLRDRRDDIPLLVDHFLRQCSLSYAVPLPKISPDAVDALCQRPWPDNVRALKSCVERVVLRAWGRPVTMADLRDGALTEPTAVPADARSVRTAAALVSSITHEGGSFWTVVHARFMTRDLTRRDVRAVVRLGLTMTHGDYRALVRLFNMPPADYRRFMRFLSAHDCRVTLEGSRGAPTRTATRPIVEAGRNPQ